MSSTFMSVPKGALAARHSVRVAGTNCVTCSLTPRPSALSSISRSSGVAALPLLSSMSSIVGGATAARKQHPQRRASLLIARGKIEKLNGEQLEVAIADRSTPLVVDFFATWCGPCLLLAQELEKVAESMGEKVRIVKVDVDENPDLSSMLRIEGLPTIVFIPKDSSKAALRTEGLMMASQITEIISGL